ncbi:CBS domain-containing protein [Litoribrevibacter albus]|uniref:CBS domain-containing protein n=1 Tax=Litoribrevibacter albus TaxID=1473156 RepID=A0AA37SAY7_9GAMM|nr:CBS domain-containing protein [Litoribrevibacter albus]GLQ31324.1 CBS domain-containing protein [Litoribrevibacter albus]
MKVSDLMTPNVETVKMDTLLSDIWKIFKQHRFHHLPVVDEHNKLIGMISDRDVLYHISPRVESGNATVAEIEVLRKPAHQFMSRGPLTVYPNTSAARALRTIIEQSVSCLPVVDDEKNLLGILTWRDVIKFVLRRVEGGDASANEHDPSEGSVEPVQAGD